METFWEEDTLKSQTMRLTEGTEWTKELEPSVLTEAVQKSNAVAKGVNSAPDTLFATNASPVYPRLEGFTSLDSSLLPTEARTVAEGFCQSICQNKNADAYMAKASAYELLLFCYDLRQKYGSAKPFFDYILGAPFISGEGSVIQCPVRFFCKSGEASDAVLLMEKEANIYKVRQIRLKGGSGR